MDNLNNIPNVGNWGDAASKLNDNFNKVKQAVTTVENTSKNNKGYFTSLSALNTAFPTPKAGLTAYVYDEASSTKYYIYNAVNGTWASSTVEAPSVGVDIAGYTKTGGSTKTTKDIDDIKANHGYESNPKTLKDVDDDLAQLAGDVSLFKNEATVKLTNLINNGNFIESTGWALTGGASIQNGELVLQGSVSFIATKLHDYIINHSYYFRAVHESTSDTAVSVSLRAGGSSFASGSLPANVGKDTRSFILTPISATPTYLQISRGNAGTYGTIIIDDIMVIDLTETFGAGNEPTAVEMDTLIEILGNNYFDGEITITAQKAMQWHQHLNNAKASHGYETAEPKTLKEVDDEKANHGYESNPKTLKDVDDDLAQLAGDLSDYLKVSLENLKEGGIKTKHTDFLRESKNLLDIESVKLGYTLTAEGEEIVNSDFVISDYIPVEDIDRLYFNSDFLIRIYFYGEAKNFILSLDKKVSIFSVAVPKTGVDIRYARLRFSRVHTNKNIMVNSESETIPFEPYGVFFTKNPNVITEKSVTPNDTTFIKDSPNLFKKEGIKLGYDLSQSDGEEFINSVTAITDFIELEGVDVLVGTLEVTIHAYFYDENKAFLDVLIKGPQVISFNPVPLGSRYVRFRVAIVNVDVDIMVNEGSVLLPYEPYGLSFTKKVVGISASDGGLDDFIINEGDNW